MCDLDVRVNGTSGSLCDYRGDLPSLFERGSPLNRNNKLVIAKKKIDGNCSVSQRAFKTLLPRAGEDRRVSLENVQLFIVAIYGDKIW